MNKITVGIVSLGCDKNRVDSEMIMYKLAQSGFRLVNEPSEAEIIIVNTCAFIESARKESIDTIFEMASYKQSGSCKKLVITGCLPQMYQKELFAQLPEADYIAGINTDNIAQTLEKLYADDKRLLAEDFSQNPCKAMGRILSTPKHLAYLKIADGCNNFCSYCSIPYIRGRFRSVPMDDLVAQSKELTQNGVKELILVAQDVTKYGVDLYGKPEITSLIDRLSNETDVKWIRLLYCYPELVTDQLLDVVANNPKVVKYLDIPLQHVNDDILRKMNRRSSNKTVIELFDKLRSNFPQIALRSTFICGFPSETPEQNNVIADFLRKYLLDNVGFFAYSQEENTPAGKMPDQIDGKTKRNRVDNLYCVQQSLLSQINSKYIGSTQQIVIEERSDDDGYYIGRIQSQAPDIDGTTFVRSDKSLEIGDFYNVKIVAHNGYDLIGELL